jgi:hypothetical protein
MAAGSNATAPLSEKHTKPHDFLVISGYFKYHLFTSFLIGIAHDGSATTSNIIGSTGAGGLYYR